MARKTSVLGFSVSSALAKKYERLAECEGTTKSDLLRRMLTIYTAERKNKEVGNLFHASSAPSAAHCVRNRLLSFRTED